MLGFPVSDVRWLARRGDELARFAESAVAALDRSDPYLSDLLRRDLVRQRDTLMLVAAASVAHPSVIACEAAALANVTAEGYPGARYHAGSGVADEIERLAIERARRAFGAAYANVQPHSGYTANVCVITALLKPGDTLLGLDLAAGGHLSHGSAASIIGQQFHTVPYTVDTEGRIDYDQVAELALRHRPKLIICGASAYPRRIDFVRFREIADASGALLLADISHIAGLVVAGEHPSPIDHAHVTTTSTYKQLFGPRGGLILIGRDADATAPNGRMTLAQRMQRAVFPRGQGTPNIGGIAAKARALAIVAEAPFRQVARRIVDDAATLARVLRANGWNLVTGGTDNHMVLLSFNDAPFTGAAAERALELCGIVTNRNRVPGDKRPFDLTSGLRLGTNTLAYRGMGEAEMGRCAALLDRVLRSIRTSGGADFLLDAAVRGEVSRAVSELCRAFPLPGYDGTRPASTAPQRPRSLLREAGVA